MKRVFFSIKARAVAFAFFVVGMSFVLSNRFDIRASNVANHQNASSAEMVVQNPVNEGIAPSVDETEQTTRKNDVLLNYSTVGASGMVWGAISARDAMAAIRTTDPKDVRFNGLLSMIKLTCHIAWENSTKIIDPKIDSERRNQEATTAFLKTYCGNVAELKEEINAKLAALAEAQKNLPKHDIETLLEAGVTTVERFDAIVNEVLISGDPDIAGNLAATLTNAAKPGGPMQSWNRYFPANASADERHNVLLIASEQISCQISRSCGANQLYSMLICSEKSRCQPGEDLLSYRRRTTSPMLYQAAEQIAAAMQARRYR